MAGRPAAKHMPEVEHFLATGRICLLYPEVDISAATKLPRLEAKRKRDLRPSAASRSEVFGKRASVLGRPIGRNLVEVEEGVTEDRVEHDGSCDPGYGANCVYVIDGTPYLANDGQAFNRRPTIDEMSSRIEAGMIVGDEASSIVRVPLA